MKKLLAVLLATIMTFSLSSASFATFVVPDLPAQTEGVIHVAAESRTIEAGQEYTIPVYVISNYTPAINAESFVISLSAGMSGNAGSMVHITGVTISDGVKALNGYTMYDEGVDKEETAWLAFSVDDTSLLKQAKFKIADITIKVDDTFPGEVDPDNPDVDKEAVIDLSFGDASWTGVVGEEAINHAAAAVYNSKGEAEGIGADPDNAEKSKLFVDAGHYGEPEPQKPVKDIIVEWLKAAALKIVKGLIAVLEILEGFLMK